MKAIVFLSPRPPVVNWVLTYFLCWDGLRFYLVMDYSKKPFEFFLQALRKHKPGLYKKVKDELSYDYLKDDFDLTEKDKDKTKVKIKEMAKDLYHLKPAFENHNQIMHYETFKTLEQVFEQQCNIKTQDPMQSDDTCEVEKASSNSDSHIDPTNLSLVEIEIREKPLGDKIISTPHNTDAQYTKKRKQTVVGHKGFATETCDTDNEVQFITDVNLKNATHSDAKEISQIEQRLEGNELKPEILYGDAGFVNGDNQFLNQKKNKLILQVQVQGVHRV